MGAATAARAGRGMATAADLPTPTLDGQRRKWPPLPPARGEGQVCIYHSRRQANILVRSATSTVVDGKVVETPANVVNFRPHEFSDDCGYVWLDTNTPDGAEALAHFRRMPTWGSEFGPLDAETALAGQEDDRAAALVAELANNPALRAKVAAAAPRQVVASFAEALAPPAAPQGEKK